MLIWSIDCGTSNKTTVTNSAAISAVTNILTTVKSNAIQNVSNVQSLTIDVLPGGQILCGNGQFNFSQYNGTMATITGSFSSQDYQNITTQLQQLVNNSVSQTSQDIIDFLSQQGLAQNRSDLASKISSAITTNVVTTLVEQVQQTISSVQNGTLIVGGTIQGTQCNLSQKSIMNVYAANLMNNLTDYLINNSDVSDIFNAVENYAKSHSAGIFSFLGYLKWIVIGVIIIVLLIIIGFVIYFLFRHKSTPSPQPLISPNSQYIYPPSSQPLISPTPPYIYPSITP